MEKRKSTKAIIFDMDGVLIDSEREWQKIMPEFQKSIGVFPIPEEIAKQSYGISMQTEHKLFQEKLGIKLSLNEFIAAYDKYAFNIYSKTTLAQDLESSLKLLKSNNLKLGIVTASVNSWCKMLISRLNQNYFDIVISLADNLELKQKPSPDGYLYAIAQLNVSPENTIIIEDSSRGINAAKASGALTLASTEFIDKSYEQNGYDFKISSLSEISKYINN